MKFLVPFVAICSLGMLATVRGAPFNSYDTVEELVVPESKVIDFDNLTESERVDLLRNQINITAVKLQQQRLRDEAAQRNLQRAGAPLAIKQSATEPNVSSHAQNRKAFEKQIIGNIRQSIESNLMRNDSYVQMGATHEMAFSAVCDLPKHTDPSVWNDDLTWNLYFPLTHSKPYTSVSSAILRLYMNGAGNSTDVGWNRREDENCKDPADQMIRVTVSVYMRKKNKDNSSMDRKKRICSTINITRNNRGWITLDTLLAVKQWDKPNRNMGIAIDVQDQDDNPLPAARFFQPADCSEASKTNATAAVLPWSFFRNSLSWSSDEMDDVPHVPRIDIMMMHKPLYQQYQHHSHHSRLIFRPKHQHVHHHYGGVRYRLDNASASSSSSSSSSSAVANSFEDEVEIKQHPSVHVHQTKPHKKRHLNNHNQQHVAIRSHRAPQFENNNNNSAESEEDYSASASREERKL